MISASKIIISTKTPTSGANLVNFMIINYSLMPDLDLHIGAHKRKSCVR